MAPAGSQPFPAGEGRQRPLQQYLPRLVLFWDDEAPGARHRAIEGSMVFVDISGFTKMSERLARHGRVGAEEVSEVIGDTFARLLTTAYSYGAGLLKFGGDALLLWFSDEGHALRACTSAYSMRQTLRDLKVFQTTAGNVSLRMSIGIHSGEFDFFMAGGSHRELIVAGPAVTRTVLMESAAGAGQILISPETAAYLSGPHRGRAVAAGLLLKGQPGGVEHQDVVPTTSGANDLAPYIPVALRDTLLAGNLDPGHRPAAVAFLQFIGLDQMITTDGVLAAAETIDTLVRVVQESVEARQVTFLGTDIAADGGKIILASGVPTATGHDEEQMLLALRSIVATTPPIPIRIGVNWGHVFAGEIGPPYRRTFTVMGDAVNLSARLMARATPGDILSTQEVLEGSRTVFMTTALEPFMVKGKRKPVDAFSVGAAEGIRVTTVAAGAPLLGRDTELAALQHAWRSSLDGNGSAIELVAEAGMGKSRLLEEFLNSVDGANLIRAECRLYQSATPYFPFQTLLRSALGLNSDDPVAELKSMVAARAPELTPWLALMAVPLNLEVEESEEVAQLEDEFRRARINQSIRRILQVSVNEPTVFVIEDTHWMDEASGDLLAALLEEWGQSPWLLCVSRRPGDDGVLLPDEANPTRLQLGPLTRSHAEALIIAATTGTPLMPQQIEALAERAEGSPLFLIELLQALRQGGAVDELPHSVEGLIGARIDKLPPADRSVLRRLAVLGAGFRAEHAQVVLPESESRLRGRAPVHGIVKRLGEFLSMDQTGWIRFRHALIRDAAYEGLPFRTRQTLHARVGDSIRDASNGQPNTQAALLSLHYTQARRWSEAWSFSRVAGDTAKDVYANLDAAAFYRRALAAARHVKDIDPGALSTVAESLGDVLEQGGMFQESIEAFRQAIRLIGDTPIRRADLLLKRARARARMGAYASAFREISSGRRIVSQLGSIEGRGARARLTALSAQLRQLQEHPRAALKLARTAMAEAEESGEQEALARSYQVLDAAYNMLGQPTKAEFGEKALDIYESLGYLPGIAIVTNNLGGQAYFEGKWNVALDYYAKAQDAFHRAGNEPEAATSGANIGEVLVSQGKFAEAEIVLSESVRVLRAHKLIDAAIFAEIQLSRLHLLTGRQDAEYELSRIRTEATNVGQTHSAVEAAIYIALAMVRRGDPAGAVELLGEAERTSGGEAELYGCSLARVRAEALAAMGNIEEAAMCIRAGLTKARQEGLAYEEALLLRTEAELIADPGDRAKKLEEAKGLLQQLGVVTV